MCKPLAPNFDNQREGSFKISKLKFRDVILDLDIDTLLKVYFIILLKDPKGS